MSRDEIARCNGHAAVVVRPAVKHVPGSVIRDAHERIVGCGLVIVAVSSPLGHAVEQIPGGDVRPPGTDHDRGRLDPWRPSWIVSSRRVIYRDEEKVGEQDLSSGKDEEVAIEGRVIRRIRSRSGLRQACPVPFQERGRSVKDQWARHHQNFAVRFERGRTIGDNCIGQPPFAPDACGADGIRLLWPISLGENWKVAEQRDRC